MTPVASVIAVGYAHRVDGAQIEEILRRALTQQFPHAIWFRIRDELVVVLAERRPWASEPPGVSGRGSGHFVNGGFSVGAAVP